MMKTRTRRILIVLGVGSLLAIINIIAMQWWSSSFMTYAESVFRQDHPQAELMGTEMLLSSPLKARIRFTFHAANSTGKTARICVFRRTLLGSWQTEWKEEDK